MRRNPEEIKGEKAQILEKERRNLSEEFAKRELSPATQHLRSKSSGLFSRKKNAPRKK